MRRFAPMTFEMRVDVCDPQPRYEKLVRHAPGRFGIAARRPDGTPLTIPLGPFRWPRRT